MSMHNRLGAAGWIAVTVAVTATWAARAAPVQTFEKTHATAIERNPPGVVFTVRLAKKTFHFGEPIEVELLLSASEPARWQITSPGAEGFVLDAGTDAAEPIDYQISMMFWREFAQHENVLDEKPTVVGIVLNDRVWIKKPGKYRMFVAHGGMVDLTKPAAERDWQRLGSGIVEFEVLGRDEAWERAQLMEIAAGLDSGKSTEVREAVRRLRRMATPEAAMELARRLRNDNHIQEEYAAGIAGFPDREAAKRVMNERLVAPDHPVRHSFLEAMADLEPPPPRDGEPGVGGMFSSNGGRMRVTQPRPSPAMLRNWATLAAAIDNKTPEAKAASVLTLLTMGYMGPTPPQGIEKVREAAVALLPSMSAEDQYRALNGGWRAIKSPELLPLVLSICREQPRKVRPSNFEAEMLDLCLRRAYELDPAAARPLILEAMRDPSRGFHRVFMQSLLLLPDPTLADLEDGWAQALEGRGEGDADILTRLIARYATDKPLARLKTIYGSPGRWACACQTNLLAYFLRVDRAYGMEQLRLAVATRGQTHCWSGQLSSVAGLTWVPELEAMCVESLMDGRTQVACSAAEALGYHGSAAVKEKLLQALAAPWTPGPRDNQDPKDPRGQREDVIAKALLDSRAWVLTDNELTDLDGLVHTTRSKQLIAQRRWDRGRDVTVCLFERDGGTIKASIGHLDVQGMDAAKQTLLLFPKDTTFKISHGWPGATAAEYEKLRAWAKENGIVLKD